MLVEPSKTEQLAIPILNKEGFSDIFWESYVRPFLGMSGRLFVSSIRSRVMQQIKIDTKQSYEGSYNMRQVGGGISTSIPKVICERKAKELGISLDVFIKNYEVVMFYDNFQNVDGVFLFRRKKRRNKIRRNKKSKQIQKNL